MFRFISPGHFLPICLAGLCKKLVNRLILRTARSLSFLLHGPCIGLAGKGGKNGMMECISMLSSASSKMRPNLMCHLFVLSVWDCLNPSLIPKDHHQLLSFASLKCADGVQLYALHYDIRSPDDTHPTPTLALDRHGLTSRKSSF